MYARSAPATRADCSDSPNNNGSQLAFPARSAWTSGPAALAASRDEELSRCRQQVRQLQELLRTAELQSGALRDRESELARRLAEQERMAARSQELTKTDNYEYLKNVIVKYMMTGDEVRNAKHRCARTHASGSWSGAVSCVLPPPHPLLLLFLCSFSL